MSVDLLLRRRALLGENEGFSVSDNQCVRFAQGNLQYQASTGTWRFAQNQYDFIGLDNNNISPAYRGWIDLFGYGTSGYNNGQACYMPTSSSTSTGDYYDDDLLGDSDWGYNVISNGGSQIGLWRTLTSDEWYYLLLTRSTESGYRFVKSTVAGISGLLLFPDNWEIITPISNVNVDNAPYSTFTATASEWEDLEQLGCVFLPTAGARQGTATSNVGTEGFYWSSTYKTSQPYGGYCLVIIPRQVYLTYHSWTGLSVRLARNI